MFNIIDNILMIVYNNKCNKEIPKRWRATVDILITV